MAEDLYALPIPKRVARYRELAKEARKVAANTRDPLGQETYLNIADRWEQLADDLETPRATGPVFLSRA